MGCKGQMLQGWLNTPVAEEEETTKMLWQQVSKGTDNAFKEATEGSNGSSQQSDDKEKNDRHCQSPCFDTQTCV